MVDVARLSTALDPLRPLGGDEDSLYVNWQQELDPQGTDTKSRLARAFVRSASPERPVTRLLTGHKGSGKTTELNRVRRRVEQGEGDKRIFVSTLFAQRWLDLEDLQPEDLVLQIVRQLVADLAAAGMPLGEKRFSEFLRSLPQKARGVTLDKAELGLQPLKFSFALKDFPTARSEFREVLRGQLPNVFDLVNRELLPAAREHVGKIGYDDILLIVDDLDKIPQKILADGRVTNHENLFLDNAATLRAVNSSLLLTVPIELAYSPAQGRLRDDYGASIVTVPLISIADRDGTPNLAGEDAMIEILGRRALAAFDIEGLDPREAVLEIFVDEDLLRRVVRLSGGHVRSLLVLVTELLDWTDELPISGVTVDRYLPRAAKDLARALFKSDHALLEELEKTGEPPEDQHFWDLVRNHYVFAYEAGDEEYWYGLNPLLKEVGL